MHSLGMERLVGDIGKGFGNFNSCFCLPRADKTLCMMDVCWGKLGGATTRRFIEVRTVFRVKPRDGTKTIYSRSCNILGRMASIKQRKDVLLASRG